MKVRTILMIALLPPLATMLGSCAVVPFIPMIAHVVPRVLDPGHQPSSGSSAPDPAPAQADPAPGTGAFAGANAVPALGERPPGSGVPMMVSQVGVGPADDGSIPFQIATADPAADLSARRVGDILQIDVVESINGQTSAQTNLTNKRTVNAGVPNFFSAVESLAQHNPLLDLANLINGTSENDASGQGDMTADDTINATISARVVGVTPAGVLRIRGARRVRLNGEDDTMIVTGLVRPEDVDANNTVPSTEIADLNLSFVGEGLVRDKQGGGWGARLMDWLWMF